MAQVDFYVMQDEGADPDRFACRLARKGFDQGLSVFVRVSDADHGRSLDELMWTFDQLSFLPHALVEAADTDTPICIGVVAPEETGLLINLAGEAPASPGGSKRIAEVVGPDVAARNAGRQRYKHYQSLGFKPITHKMAKA